MRTNHVKSALYNFFPLLFLLFHVMLQHMLNQAELYESSGRGTALVVCSHILRMARKLDKNYNMEVKFLEFD
jgi:hypothetical protein